MQKLAEKANLFKKMAEEQKDTIAQLNPLNIEARYPEYKNRIAINITNDICQRLLNRNGGIVVLDQATAISAVEQYANAVIKEFTPAAIVLYGSYAKGNPHEDSDIDVAVIFNGFSGDWLKTSTRLWRLIEDISFDIEPILLDSTEDNSGFVRNVFKTGQIIYQA